jgi:hypothetical protein
MINLLGESGKLEGITLINGKHVSRVVEVDYE